MIKPGYIMDAFVTHVIDGDTVEMRTRLPFHLELAECSFRLHGIDTRELNSKNADDLKRALEAKAYVENAILGKDVVIRTIRKRDGHERKTLDRYLAVIYYEREDGKQINLNEELVALGLAREWVK